MNGGFLKERGADEYGTLDVLKAVLHEKSDELRFMARLQNDPGGSDPNVKVFAERKFNRQTQTN